MFSGIRKRAFGAKRIGVKRARTASTVRIPRGVSALARPYTQDLISVKMVNIIDVAQTAAGLLSDTYQVWDTTPSADWANYAGIYSMYSVESIQFQYVPRNSPVDGASRGGLNNGVLFITFVPDDTPTAVGGILGVGVANSVIEQYTDVTVLNPTLPFTYRRKIPPRVIGQTTTNIAFPGWAATAQVANAGIMPGAINWNFGAAGDGTAAAINIGVLKITRRVKFAGRH